MAYGLPATIGASVANSGALVINVESDTSFAMSLSEMSTASQLNVPRGP